MFFLHVRGEHGLPEDPEGSNLPSLEGACVEALESARKILAAKVTAGVPIDRRGFEIADGSGNVLALLPFGHAL